MSKTVKLALDNNIPFIKHYQQLQSKFQNHSSCLNHYIQESNNKIQNSFSNISDINSPLGTYKVINPELSTPSFDLNESERILITRYRSGSHYLNIEKGRWRRIIREHCFCDKCDLQEIQNIFHVLYRCPVTATVHAVQTYFYRIFSTLTIVL